MKSVLKYLAFALVMGLLLYGVDAAAQDANVFTRALNTLGRVFKNVRVIVYIIGAFGLIAIAIGGIVGKINFKWLGYLAAGLAIVAGADAVVTYATKSGTSSGVTEDISNNWTNKLQ
ncbi:MAG: TrbC/VirB2 family protein [Alphaproteobacteria bacterium]|nr:TrbC/VirB2 family protein [Alphaproteobacteria bacterium]